jgi:hypothetical protein
LFVFFLSILVLVALLMHALVLLSGLFCVLCVLNDSVQEDMYAQDSIDLLKEAGLDFARHEESGIDVQYFGELMVTSGLVGCAREGVRVCECMDASLC